MGGTWPAGQRSSPAEPVAAQLRRWDPRDGGRSLSALRPDSLCQCSALAWLLTQPHSGLHMVELAECWLAPRPTVVRSRPAADLYAFGQWSVAWSHLARSSRSVGPWALAWLDHASGSSVQCWLTLCGAQLAAACSRQGEEAVASLRPCITSLDLRWIGPGGGCCNNRQHLLGHRYMRACVDYRVK